MSGCCVGSRHPSPAIVTRARTSARCICQAMAGEAGRLIFDDEILGKRATAFLGHQHNGRIGIKKIIIRTELGDIFAEIYEDKAPVTAGNFSALCRGLCLYGASTFYRVVRPDSSLTRR